MKKLTFQFIGEVTINVEENEEWSEVIAELEVIHPDNTRVVDYTMENWEVMDSR